MEVHFIVNEKAGNGKGKKIWNKLKDQLSVQYFEHITQFSGHALQLSESISNSNLHQSDFALIVAVGGDGTIHEVLNGIVEKSNIYIGFVKAGSGNDYSRAYHSFQSAKEIELFLKTPYGMRMDSGLIQATLDMNRKFINNAGIGFDGFVSRNANRSKIKGLLNKFGLGKLSYGFLTITSLFTFKPFNIEVIVDNRRFEYKKAWFVTVSNQPYFGGGMKLSPESKPDDGVLEVTIVHNLHHLKLLFLFGTVFLGTHTKLSEVTQLKGTQIQVRVEEPQYFHADGEVLGSTNQNSPITYRILKDYWISTDYNRNSTPNLSR
ncbi:diacylglycerol/lipid kinase family protein [Ureibacillus acetophenoni]|uniref:YegS/Rv2252/BmrU family lipid kinase n=1 Tax=Ureibacillus acetophenoni TaxID=614649 RepID=A0A285U3V5_9BACL|nr:diacylglycerol kinase family protein [Ureibacillus acetophenoni]SOC36630.1 YegS/Rv2252/BmrU family lipid kinase [Ureibacillus acetophenoni]